MIDLIEEAAIPIAMVGLLYALPNTQLTRRLAREGRLHVDHDACRRARAIRCTAGVELRDQAAAAGSPARLPQRARAKVYDARGVIAAGWSGLSRCSTARAAARNCPRATSAPGSAPSRWCTSCCRACRKVASASGSTFTNCMSTNPGVGARHRHAHGASICTSARIRATSSSRSIGRSRSSSSGRFVAAATAAAG